MKKIIGIFAILSVMLIITACGGSEETRTFEFSEPGIESEIIYTHKGDKVLTQETNNTADYEAIGVSSQEELEPFAERYEDIDGVTYSITYEEDSFSENLLIDFDEVDFDELKEKAGLEFEGDTSKGISMKESAKLIESQGFTEKE